MKCWLVGALVAVLLYPAGAIGAYEHRSLVVGGQTASVTLVRVPLVRYRVGVALAGPRVSDNASLLEIARRAGATCAINGTFLAAYTGETGEPYGTLVVEGKVLHLGAVGTRLDVLPDGTVHLARDGLQIQGGLDGIYTYPANWYAYNINQTPLGATGAYVFTPERGATLGFRADVAVVARRGVVVGIVRGQDVPIPTDGFIVIFQGNEVHIQAWKFSAGQRIEYRVIQNRTILKSRYSLGAGPRLIDRGTVHVNPLAEGFREAKIVSLRQARSAVGFTDTGEVVLAAIDHATVAEAAEIMKVLGAVDAMNLDGGASSGLVCDGTYLVRPGRQVANALVLWPADK